MKHLKHSAENVGRLVKWSGDTHRSPWNVLEIVEYDPRKFPYVYRCKALNGKRAGECVWYTCDSLNYVVDFTPKPSRRKEDGVLYTSGQTVITPSGALAKVVKYDPDSEQYVWVMLHKDGSHKHFREDQLKEAVQDMGPDPCLEPSPVDSVGGLTAMCACDLCGGAATYLNRFDSYNFGKFGEGRYGNFCESCWRTIDEANGRRMLLASAARDRMGAEAAALIASDNKKRIKSAWRSKTGFRRAVKIAIGAVASSGVVALAYLLIRYAF